MPVPHGPGKKGSGTPCQAPLRPLSPHGTGCAPAPSAAPHRSPCRTCRLLHCSSTTSERHRFPTPLLWPSHAAPVPHMLPWACLSGLERQRFYPFCLKNQALSYANDAHHRPARDIPLSTRRRSTTFSPMTCRCRTCHPSAAGKPRHRSPVLPLPCPRPAQQCSASSRRPNGSGWRPITASPSRLSRS